MFDDPAIDLQRLPFEAIPADLTRPHNAARLVEDALAKFGKIDALVHTAGGFAGGAPIHETDDATWDSMLELNLRSALHILRAVLPTMRARQRGRIVAIGSRAGVETFRQHCWLQRELVGLVRAGEE